MSGRGEMSAPAPARGSSTSLLPYLASVHATWLDQASAPRWSQDEATLVFADISGFTPLTERLARRGKVGGEELTDLLNAVFTSLLAVAAGYGGDCLKFGGDAVLLHFTGPGHAHRAREAAHGMLQALRPFHRLRTAAGTVELGMSIGVHTGAPLLVMCGATHRELIVAGHDTTRTLAAEAAASSGEVNVSDGPRTLPVRLGTTLPAGAAVDLARGVPEQLRDYLSGALHEGEHRPAAIGFLQCGGTDDLLSREGPDALVAALDDVMCSVQRACAEHGVTFIASDVDKGAVKFVLAAGTPVASPDDGLRLVRALSAVVHGTAPLPVRAGATKGRLFAVDLGSPDRRTFTLIGDSTNLAARIMGAAQWQQVWAEQGVLERHRGQIAIRSLPPFAVKGKTEPVNAVEVEVATSAPVPVTTSIQQQRLFGRERELDALGGLITSTARGSGGVAEVVGDPGIGKSALVAHVTDIARADGLNVFALEAGRYTQVTSYFPLRFPLRQHLDMPERMGTGDAIAHVYGVIHDRAPSLLPWVPLIGPALGVDIPDTPETARLERAQRSTRAPATIAALLRAVLPGPTLLLLEDAHWLDTASSAVLDDLAAHAPSASWAIIATRRPEDGGFRAGDDSTRLRLEPLSRAAAVELAREALGERGALLPGLVDQLIERAAGNPLFLHELVVAAAAGELTELPETVEAVLAASIDVLPADDRTLLRWAAVLGARLPTVVLATMMGLSVDELSTRVHRLSRFLDASRPRQLRFRHALMRDVAYEGLAYKRRRELHALAGKILEQLDVDRVDSIAELLSTHFHMAHQFAKSWHYSRMAGERSERTAAPIEATLFYQRALDAARHIAGVTSDDRADVAVRLGDVCELAGRYPEARSAYRLARRLIGDDALGAADLGRRTGVTWEREGRLREALSAYQRARTRLVAITSDEARLLSARLSVAYGAARLRQGHYRRAQAELQRAVELAREERGTSAYGILAHAYRLLDWIDIELGIEREVPLRNLSLRLYDELGDDLGRANVLNNMGIAAYYRGEWDEAADMYGRALEGFRKAGEIVTQAVVMNNIAEVRSDQGHLDEAEAMLREAVEIWRGSNNAMLGMGLGNLGRVAARSGRLDEARQWYDESRQVCTRMKESAMALETDAREAERRLFAGESAAALLAAADVYERALQLGGNPYVLMLADRTAGYALAQLGDVRMAWSRIGRSLMRSRENRSDYETALNLQALVRVGHLRGVQVEEFAAESVRLFTGLGVVRTPEVPLPTIEIPEQTRTTITV